MLPMEVILNQALADFRKHLKNEAVSGGLKYMRKETMEARLRGAEHFAMYLLGKKPPKRPDRPHGAAGR